MVFTQSFDTTAIYCSNPYPLGRRADRRQAVNLIADDEGDQPAGDDGGDSVGFVSGPGCASTREFESQTVDSAD